MDSQFPVQCLWVQPRLAKRQYELRSGDTQIGFLNYKGWMSGSADAAVLGETFLLKGEGMIMPRLSLRHPEATAESASAKLNLTGGARISTQSGGLYTFQCRSFWRGDWSILSATQAPILSLRLNPGGFSVSAKLTVHPAASECPELAALAVLGWCGLLAASHHQGIQ